MTIETIPNSDLKYYLIAYDKEGTERDDPDASNGKLTESLVSKVSSEPITDVFFACHGWKGDIPAAKEQYDKWMAAMVSCANDRKTIREKRQGFNPLLIGLHWPSLPFGNERLESESVSFGHGGSGIVDTLIEEAAQSIADSTDARAALQTIFQAASNDLMPTKLPVEVVNAYKTLCKEAGLVARGPAAAPGQDAEAFDPEVVYQNARNDVEISYGGFSFGGLLSPLRQLSFWKMKDRARRFGESGAGKLLRTLQESAPPERNVHFHLMGHSFGCIVVSATVAGIGLPPLIKPVDTVFLVQGALSLWSYCADIPVAKGNAGYFHSICRDGLVSGPIVTTQSEYDTAVGRLYPLAAGIAGQISYGAADELPKYGALGTFGIQGDDLEPISKDILPLDASYCFEKGKIYNLDGRSVINEGDGPSGAHSDIAKPEVAHAFWDAVMT